MSFIKTTALALAVMAGTALAAQAQTGAPSTGPNTQRGGDRGATAAPGTGAATPASPTGVVPGNNPTGAGVVPGTNPTSPTAPSPSASGATGSGPQR